MSPETIPQITDIIPQVTESIQQTGSSMIDRNEIIYILVGAVIGTLSSIVVLVIERSLDKKGKLNVFYRCVQHPGSSAFPIEFVDKSEYVFLLPIRFEFQNTANIPRVIRNIDILLYCGKKYVGRMAQISKVEINSKQTPYDFGGEKHSYSFAISPRSIQAQICDFYFSVKMSEKEEKAFDTVVIRYYNEKNKPQTFKLLSVSNCWEENWYCLDADWKLLEEKINIRE